MATRHGQILLFLQTLNYLSFSMKSTVSVIMLIAGCLLVILGLWLASFFYEFPAIPGILSVTFWRDTGAFLLVAAAGMVLLVLGIVRLTKSLRRMA